MNMNKRVTIIIPAFNESENISLLLNRLIKCLKDIKNIDFEILFVDDGSTDQTILKIEEMSKKNSIVKAIQLSRNFGSHVAISAGIENVSTADAIVVISADLQEPPEIIKKLIVE